jgi:arylsulfatase A-like enzyme
VTDNFWPESLAGLALNETTIAELLKQANYTTAILGKSVARSGSEQNERSRGCSALVVALLLLFSCGAYSCQSDPSI